MNIDTVKLRSLNEAREYGDLIGGQRKQVESLIAKECKNKKSWKTPGFCEACGAESLFLTDWLYSNKVTPNFRERLVCEKCGLNNRQRFIAGMLGQLQKASGGGAQDVYVYEQTTQFYKYAKNKLAGLNVTGSEYLGHGIQGGTIVKGLRHEDALGLSFNDGVMDIIVSNDVFEHVPDIEKALAESCRVLKAGGKMIFSVPFYGDRQKSAQRAVVENSGIRNILPEQYHGNPVSKKGSLVFYDFGWDLLEKCGNAGFKDAFAIAYYSYFYGYLGEPAQLVFEAQK